MKIRKNFLFVIFVIIISCLFSRQVVFAIGEISSTVIDPLLNISIFAPYKIKSVITGSPISASVNISGINGNLTNNEDWNYYVDGTSDSDSRTKTMTYDAVEEKWISTNVYPDDIYPEIFFAPSNITWNNTPSNIVIRRSNYHIFHFQNPFTMAASSSFFIELNTLAKNSNSQSLSVYLIAKDQTSSYFINDWRNKAQTELIGTIFRNDSFHHTHHITNSAHRLIPLATNDDGTIGAKHLNVDGDFWIVLYSNSPNDNLGWDLRYQNSNLCDNDSEWYIGSTNGWTMNHQSGCPDTHVHIARRGPTYIDGARAIVTANYSDGSSVSTSTFSFGELPNLAPNPTTFINPVSGGVYDGGVGEEISIQWATSTDPNGDDLTYNIYLSTGIATTTLVSTTTDTSFNWDIGGVNNGDYYLSGEVCDADLCTDFNLIGIFTIQKIDPIYSLADISILSNNSNTGLAKLGDQIILTFTSSGDISESLNINLYSGGSLVVGDYTTSSIGNDWTVNYTIQESDVSGPIDFVINADNLDLQYSDTSDGSYVLVDLSSPVITISGSNPVSLFQNQTYTDSGATAIDNLDGDITSSIVVTNNVNTVVIGSYTVVYVVSDTVGNISTSTRIVNVVNSPSGGTILPPSNELINNDTNDNESNNNQTSEIDNFTDGLWIKIDNIRTVYFVNEQSKTRHIYPSEAIWRSYFGNDFSFVETVSKQDLSSYKLGRNVVFKKGTLFKIPSVPKVYLVDDNGLIHWIKTESTAIRLYGENWKYLVYDLNEAFFGDYTEGRPIE